MAEVSDGAQKERKKGRGMNWLAFSVSCILASAAGRLTMAVVQAAEGFSFFRERESARDILMGAGAVAAIAAMVVVALVTYRAIKKYMVNAGST